MTSTQPGSNTARTLTAFCLIWACTWATGSPEVLVSVDDLQVTATDLEKAIHSSPFAVQFNTLDQGQQAALRGRVLQRLVASRLLLLEAKKQNLDKSDQYREELARFRLGLLHRRYMARLREGIKIPDETRKQMQAQFRGNHDAYKAAQSAYIADAYKRARIEKLKQLRDRYHVRIHEERILPNAAPETLILDGDGVRIPYSDLLTPDVRKPTSAWLRQRLYDRADLLLTARAASDAGIDVSNALDSFAVERLPALLLENLERLWLPDEKPLKAYYDSHPELGRILERRHIGELVLTTREEAESMRKRILTGESLFALAGEHSVDPYGRKHNGDMGWVKEDRGNPKVNAAIAKLKDGEISEIVQTPLGFHIVTVLERKPGEVRPYYLVKDKVRQMYLSEKMTAYLQDLEQQHRVVWHLLKNNQAKN